MNFLIKKIETTYNLLERTRKILVIVSSVLLLFFTWHSFLNALLIQYEKNKKTYLTVTQEVKILNEQLTILKSKKTIDRNAELMNEEVKLKKELSILSKKIVQYQYQLISYKQIFIRLKDIFKPDNNVQLLSIKQFPEERVKDTKSTPFYQHPIEITIKGKFFDVLNFLKKIEKFHTYIFWDELFLRVSDFPESTVDIKFHIITSETGQQDHGTQ